MKYIPFVFLCSLLLSCSNLRNINKELTSPDYYLKIEQIVYGSEKQYSFFIVDEKLFILENSNTKKGVPQIRNVYSKKIKNKENLKDIKEKSKELFNLDAEYVIPQLGGLRWEILLIFKQETKKIVIENTSITEINELFQTINSIIPKKISVLYYYGAQS